MAPVLAVVGSALVAAGSVFAGFLAHEAYKHKATSLVDICKQNPIPAVGMLLGILAMLIPSVPVPKVKVSLPRLPAIILKLPTLPKIALPALALPSLPKLSLPTLPSLKLPTLPSAPRISMPTMPSITIPKLSLGVSGAEGVEKLLASLDDYEEGKPLPDEVTLDGEYRHNRALESFMPQRGPTCAAASVVGALNVLFGLRTDSTMAFRVREGMNVYKAVFEGKRGEALDKLQKVIRTDPTPILSSLLSQDVCVAARSKHKERFREALREAVAAARARTDLPEGDAACLTVLSDAVTMERPSSALIIERVRAVARAEWAVAKLEGRWPLPSGKILPSTAPVGNDRIVLCIKVLGLLREGRAVRCTSFMSVRTPCRHVISKDISQEDKDRLWGELKIAIENQIAVLIFHLHNHYALIFGWRELTTSVAGKRKQILCARVGQEPTHWVDWEGDFRAYSKSKGKEIVRKSVLSTLTSWAGHKIMLAEIPSFSSKRATIDPAVTRLVDRLRASPQSGSDDEALVKEAAAESDAPSEDAQGSDDEPES